MIVYGPVPSRRLGRSLGINHIPPKCCTYSCVYCQVGRTHRFSIERQSFYSSRIVREEVRERVRQLKAQEEKVDCISFVPDGEPTLDYNLGGLIDALKPLGIKIAVISNSSLLYRKDVRKELMKADLVSLKIDTTETAVWKKINRPHSRLIYSDVLSGIRDFSDSYTGKLLTETMIVRGLNDAEADLKKTAIFIGHLQPSSAYIAIPTRPPAEAAVRRPDEITLLRSFQIYEQWCPNVEFLMGYEGNDFNSSGNPSEDLLSITSVHPMRKEAVKALLEHTSSSWNLVDDLQDRGLLKKISYEGNEYYLHKMSK